MTYQRVKVEVEVEVEVADEDNFNARRISLMVTCDPEKKTRKKLVNEELKLSWSSDEKILQIN